MDATLLSEHVGSSHTFDLDCAIYRYVSTWIRTPDAGSEFEARVKPLLGMPEEQLIGVLLSQNYDGLLFTIDGEVIGHMFFQVHGDCWHLFSMVLAKRLRGQRMSGGMIREFVSAARGANAARARFGKGVHPKMIAALRYLQRFGSEFHIEVQERGFIDLLSVPEEAGS